MSLVLSQKTTREAAIRAGEQLKNKDAVITTEMLPGGLPCTRFYKRGTNVSVIVHEDHIMFRVEYFGYAADLKRLRQRWMWYLSRIDPNIEFNLAS